MPITFKELNNRTPEPPEQPRQSVQTSVQEIEPRVQDHAKRILESVPVSQDTKADLWELWHSSKSSNELAEHLATVDIPDTLKHDLWAAKKATDPKPSVLDRAIGALHRVAEINSAARKAAESHPSVLKLLADAALTKEKQEKK